MIQKRHRVGLNRIALGISQSFLLFQLTSSLSCYRVANLPFDGTPQPSMSEDCLTTFGTTSGQRTRPLIYPSDQINISISREANLTVFSGAETHYKLSHTNEVIILNLNKIHAMNSLGIDCTQHIHANSEMRIAS